MSVCQMTRRAPLTGWPSVLRTVPWISSSSPWGSCDPPGTVVDIYSRYSPVLDPRFSYRGQDVVTALEEVCPRIGYPKTIRVDQGSEFISRDLDLWAYQKNVTLDFSRPGKPTDNAFIEAFNSRFRTECLNAHWFLSLADAREKMEDWRRDYNDVRPHSAIGYQPPSALAKRSPTTSPP